MPRPQRCRRICREPDYDRFSPNGIANKEVVILSLDEYEVIRLIDYEKMTHAQCAMQMNISRTTVTEIYEVARHKVADSIVNGKVLHIVGGNYNICDGSASNCCRQACSRKDVNDLKINIPNKGENVMRVAVTYEQGEIFQHFGHTEQFKIYDISNQTIVSEKVINTVGSGHGALAGFLAQNEVDTLICGGIGGGAQSALAEAGIQLYGGVSGNADEAVTALIAGNLAYNPDIKCSHHEGEHSCGEHHCGEDKGGCSGN